MARSFADEIVHCMPRLTSFARRLTHERSGADDLVQETVLRALSHAEQFEPGTNLVAWLSVILRNCYFNNKRTATRLVSIDDSTSVPTPSINCPQESLISLADVDFRFAALPATQREALILIGANGHSYEDAAKMVGCAVGTMKSRVSRARTELHNLLDQPASKHAPLIKTDYNRFDRAA
jgi:RNA polymerase sigma-70 factor (ECF subfamily)